MTRKEREAAKELRTELKRRLAAGEKDLTIRQGKIVQKVATNMDSENSTWLPSYGTNVKSNLKIFYTNADQFLNKRDELALLLSDEKSDIILVTEVLPKAIVNPFPESRLNIEGYKFYINFNDDESNLGTSGKRGIAIVTRSDKTSLIAQKHTCLLNLVYLLLHMS